MDPRDIRRLALKLLIEQAGSTAEFARRHDLDATYLSQLVNGHRNMGERSARNIEAKAGLPAYWLDQLQNAGLTDENGNATIPESAGIRAHKNQNDLDPDSYIFVDRFDIKLSAGNGNLAWVVREQDPISFRQSWFRKKGLTPEACKALYVRGRSMEPKLEDWDTVVIDTTDTDLIDGDIYAVVYKQHFYVKTLERTGNGIRLKSENPEFKNIDIPEEDLEHLKILGRKVWRGG